TLRTFAKGRFIYRQGEPARELFLLKQGQVQLARLTTAGKRIGLALIRPGMFFGAVPQGDEARQVCFAEVIEDAQVGVLGAVAVKQIISEQPAVTSLIISDLIQQIQLLVERLEAFAFYDAPTKLVIELLRLAHEKHTTKLAITHQQLGELTGLLRETVTKLLDAFQQEGLVELHRGQIVLRDMAGLHARQGVHQAKELFPITRLALQQPETVN
ncbi:MAG TPA: Crp/Fnr family transcriptional regulator, partial [Ktedonobacteraceae bacterium]|nr:Crp/Fnr family transcriptional regulator [Ktedonobacteraceae bacterium]